MAFVEAVKSPARTFAFSVAILGALSIGGLPETAYAQHHRGGGGWHGGGWHGGGWHGGGWRGGWHRGGIGTGAAIGLGLGAFALGSALGAYPYYGYSYPYYSYASPYYGYSYPYYGGGYAYPYYGYGYGY